MFKTFLFLSVILTVIFKANSLQCYVCYDCNKINDSYVTSCDSLISSKTTISTTTITAIPAPTSTTTSSSTTVSSTTNSTESNTASSSTTTTTTTTTTTEAPLPFDGLHLAERQERANVTWECFEGTVPVNGSDMIIRGCAAGRTNETCEVFGMTSCSFCNSDKCNGAAFIQSSVFILAVMSFAFLLKEF